MERPTQKKEQFLSDHPFFQVVDVRKDNGIVQVARCVMKYKGGFSGLGHWEIPDSALAGMTKPEKGKWVENPPGKNVVVKVSRGNMDREREALLMTNKIFSINQSARPTRLYGYGISTNLGNRVRMLVEEDIPPNFLRLNEMYSYGPSHKEVLDTCSKVCQILTRVHPYVAHYDLGNPRHVRWNPNTREVRMLDWSVASVKSIHAGKKAVESGDADDYEEMKREDVRSIGQLLYIMSTGETLIQEEVFFQKYTGKIGDTIWSMINLAYAQPKGSALTLRAMQDACVQLI